MSENKKKCPHCEMVFDLDKEPVHRCVEAGEEVDLRKE